MLSFIWIFIDGHFQQQESILDLTRSRNYSGNEFSAGKNHDGQAIQNVWQNAGINSGKDQFAKTITDGLKKIQKGNFGSNNSPEKYWYQ